VTRDGFPVRHWVFPGNAVDVTTVQQVKADLKGWRLSRCVFVGDAGMVSQDNLKALARSGGRYIVCMPIHLGGEVSEEVLSRPGRYQEVAEHACADTWRNIRDDLKRIKLAQLLSPNGTVWQVTEPLKRLKSLHIKNPPPLLQLA
jgi:Transposase